MPIGSPGSPVFVAGFGKTPTPMVDTYVPASSGTSSRYLISGVTRDGSGTALGNCMVEIYETVSNIFRGSTVSDAAGNYAVEIVGDRSVTLFAVAYLPGSPDVAGTTVNTLIAS